MSFDLYLLKFSKGEGCELPREAIRSVLETCDCKQRDEHFYDVTLTDGSRVELQANGLSGPNRFGLCVFLLRDSNKTVLNFVFNVMKASGGVLIPPSGNPRILGDANQRAELPADFAPPGTLITITECHSVEELSQMLRGTYQPPSPN